MLACAARGPLLSAPPNFDQPHDRNAWVHYAAADDAAFQPQVGTDTVIPFYAYLAKQFVFGDHHFGAIDVLRPTRQGADRPPPER